jgi:hypothetical protein
MTEDDFRGIALAFPEATENAHFGHPDFRVRNKIFATLRSPSEGWAMAKLHPEQQELLCQAEPAIFVPVKGGWGRKGATNIHLGHADADSVRSALAMAWRNFAPKTLLLPTE